MLSVFQARAEAFEVTSGVSLGGIQIGTEPQLAASPFLGLAWRTEGGFLLQVHHMLSITIGRRVGVYDRTALDLGYAWKTGSVTIGPSLSLYSVMACGVRACDRVNGIAPGGHAQTVWYFAGRLGAAVSASVDWAVGESRFVSDGPVVMATVGPILRFEVGSQ
ncbi:MAG: hypothetical protein R3B70_42600 [Polyangiaceae bacterium]